jgi:O-antigen/teichoic acid export membrane protein
MGGRRNSWSFLDASVGESFFWSLTLSVLPVVASFLVSWFIARWSGPSVWGTVTWSMAFATAVLIVAKLGLELGASRLASEYGIQRPGLLRRLLRTGMGLRIASTMPSAAITLALAPQIARAFREPGLTGPVRIAAAVIVCASIYEFYEHFLIGLNRLAAVSRIRTVMLLARIVVTISLVLVGGRAVAILWGYCGAWVVGIVLFAVLMGRYLPPPELEAAEAAGLTRRLLELSLPLAVSSASVTVYAYTDKLMLMYFDGVEEVGHYAVARNVVEVSLFPSFAAVTMLRPALASRYAAGAMAECTALIRGSLRFALVFGVLFGVLFAVLPVPLMTFVFSDSYRYAGEIMTVFVWVIVLRSLGAIVLPALLAAEKTRLYATLTMVTAGLNVVLNLLMIPRWHSRGAIAATAISYAVLFVVGLGQTFRIFSVRVDRAGVSAGIRTLLAGGLAGLLLWFVVGQVYRGGPVPSDPSVLLWSVLLVGVYASLLLVLRVVRVEEFRSALANLRNRK